MESVQVSDTVEETPTSAEAQQWTMEQGLQALVSKHMRSVGDQIAWAWCESFHFHALASPLINRLLKS